MKQLASWSCVSGEFQEKIGHPFAQDWYKETWTRRPSSNPMIQASAEDCNRIDFYRTSVIIVVRDQPVYYNSDSCIVKTCFQPTAWACKCVCASWVRNDGISTDGRFLLYLKQKPWIFLLGVPQKESPGI